MRAVHLVILLSVAGVGLACQKRVLLRASAVELGREQNVYWLCRPGEDVCTQGGAVVESEWNLSGTSRLPLPECAGGIGRILVRKVKSKGLEAIAVCLDPPVVPSCQECPGGAAPVPDMERGGVKCPEAGE